MIIHQASKLWLYLFSLGPGVRGNSFYLSKFETAKGSHLDIKNSLFKRTCVVLQGKNNVLSVSNARLSESDILVVGSNNRVNIEDEVELHDLKIMVRGNNCSICIGMHTTIGGGRFVVGGQNCKINIGADCMFSDQIEVWASDTHPIYDQAGEIINSESFVTINDSVWVGSRAIILKGNTIGSGSVVGMGTVVTSDIPENSISVGYPNRTIKNNIRWSRYYPDSLVDRVESP